MEWISHNIIKAYFIYPKNSSTDAEYTPFYIRSFHLIYYIKIQRHNFSAR